MQFSIPFLGWDVRLGEILSNTSQGGAVGLQWRVEDSLIHWWWKISGMWNWGNFELRALVKCEFLDEADLAPKHCICASRWDDLRLTWPADLTQRMLLLNQFQRQRLMPGFGWFLPEAAGKQNPRSNRHFRPPKSRIVFLSLSFITSHLSLFVLFLAISTALSPALPMPWNIIFMFRMKAKEDRLFCRANGERSDVAKCLRQKIRNPRKNRG